MIQLCVTRSTSRSYLLRLWGLGHHQGYAWNASLADAQTGVRLGFANLEALFAYLQHITEEPASKTEKAEASEQRRDEHAQQ